MRWDKEVPTPSEQRIALGLALWGVSFVPHVLYSKFRKCRQISVVCSMSFNSFDSYIRFSIGDHSPE